MENFQKIAVLIDADNTQLSKLEAVLHEVSAYGRIVVKKAYGNWRKDSLKNWEPELKRLAIRAEQQFDYVAGKNTTDIAMVIGAMDLLHNNMYDALVLVSSDSDFTPLAIRLRESGLYIIGAGVTTTPESFKNACDDFILIDYLSKADEKPAAAEHAAEPAAKKPARKTKKTTRSTKKPAAEAAPSAEPEPTPEPEPEPEPKKPNIGEIHNLLHIASEKYQDADGFVNVSSSGLYIKRVKPDFNVRAYGYSKLPELHIAASEIVSDETFEQMQAHPLWDHDVIQKHIQDMRSVAGGEYCLLIVPENGTDGLLVRSEGSSCARYSAYIPGGRLMTLVTPELERALRKCETAAKEAVRRECMQTLTGKWTCSLAELDAAFGAGLQENKILAELFCNKLARQAGHTLVEPVPSLVSLVSHDADCKKMMGLALKNVTLTLHEDGKAIFEEQGEMLFTHFGISGPLTLSASSHLGDMKKHKYEAFIDLKPALSEEQLYDRITRDFALLANHAAQGALVKLLPSSMQPVMVARWGIDPATRANQITREQKRELVQLMKHWRVSIDARGDLAHAVITSGGVSVREVDPKTMQSKKALGLYFAGEVLDVDAYTGGYNLQIAFCTAQSFANHLE